MALNDPALLAAAALAVRHDSVTSLLRHSGGGPIHASHNICPQPHSTAVPGYDDDYKASLMHQHDVELAQLSQEVERNRQLIVDVQCRAEEQAIETAATTARDAAQAQEAAEAARQEEAMQARHREEAARAT